MPRCCARLEIKAKAEVEAEVKQLRLNLNRRLALKAFQHTAAYDAAIATWLAGRVDVEAGSPSTPTHGQTQGLPLPAIITLAAERVQRCATARTRTSRPRCIGGPAPRRHSSSSRARS